MMDETKNILERNFSYIDKDNLIVDLEKISLHIEKALSLGEKYSNSIFTDVATIDTYRDIRNIIFLGMGGSAIGGNLISDYLSDEISVPIEVIRGYNLPKYANKESLIFAISYSGNTEETLSTLKKSLSVNANIIALSSGGKFEIFAKQHDFPIIKLPFGIQPRTALPYLFFPVLKILEKIGLIAKKNHETNETLNVLQKISKEYSAKSPFKDNMAKRIAFSLYKFLPLIYGTEGLLSAVAMRWKTQINENSKWPCFWNAYAELNHNEIVGYEIDNSINKMVKIVYLEDKSGLLRMKQRAEITKNLIKDKVAEYITCFSSGKEKLTRMFSLIYLGDMVSYYLAILNGINPTPVHYIENLKKELSKKIKSKPNDKD